MPSVGEGGQPGRRSAGRIGVATAGALAPVPALAHVPSSWLLVPTGAWFLFSLFVLFVGSGVVVAVRCGDRGRERERALAVKLAAGLAVGGGLLTAVLAAQGPWFILAVLPGLMSLALAVFAFLASGRQAGPR
jgi:hypothetical protein